MDISKVAQSIGGSLEPNEVIEKENELPTENSASENTNEDVENNSTNNEEVDKKETSVEETPTEEKPTEEFSLEAATEGKYKSPKDLYESYMALQKEREAIDSEYSSFKEKAITPASDYVKQINDLESKGIRVTPELMQKISIKWDEFDAKNPEQARRIVRTQMQLANPDLDDSEIDFEMNEIYGYDEEARREELELKGGYDDERIDSIIAKEKERINTKLAIQAKKDKPSLVEHQKSLTRTEGKSKEERQADIDNYLKTLDGTVSKINSITTKIGEEEVEIEATAEAKEFTKTAMNLMVTNPPKFWELVGNQEGLAKMLTQARLQGSINEEIAKRMKSKSTEEIAADLTNQKPFKTESPDAAINDNAESIEFAKKMGVL